MYQKVLDTIYWGCVLIMIWSLPSCSYGNNQGILANKTSKTQDLGEQIKQWRWDVNCWCTLIGSDPGEEEPGLEPRPSNCYTKGLLLFLGFNKPTRWCCCGLNLKNPCPGLVFSVSRVGGDRTRSLFSTAAAPSRTLWDVCCWKFPALCCSFLGLLSPRLSGACPSGLPALMSPTSQRKRLQPGSGTHPVNFLYPGHFLQEFGKANDTNSLWGLF